MPEDVGGDDAGENDLSNANGNEPLEKQPPTQTQESYPWSPATARALEDWYLRATAAQYGHQTRSDLTRHYSILLGIPAVILSTIVGTAVFATAANEPVSTPWKAIVGTVSVLAAVLAGIQTFLGFSAVAEKHRVAAFRYANVRRDITLAITRQEPRDVDKIRREMDKIGAEAPQIGEPQWTRSLNRARKEPRPWLEAGAGVAVEIPEPHVDAP